MALNNSKIRLALLQLAVSANKSENLYRASKLVGEAAAKGANVVSLPECFNSPYGNQFFASYAERIPGETSKFLSSLAKEHKVYLIGGSIPEEDQGSYYNSCTVFDPEGNLVTKYRKTHLFNIDIPGKISFKESDTLTAGNKLTTFDTREGRTYCKIGVGICFDIRFSEMASLYANLGCKLLVYPGAFNMTTGPAHWDLLQRARAVDNQLFVATVSPARDERASYVAWGHSAVVNPWGKIVGQLDHTEGVLIADIDLELVDEIRSQMPVFVGHRQDLYEKL